jgi:hypothetical protein
MVKLMESAIMSQKIMNTYKDYIQEIEERKKAKGLTKNQLMEPNY